MFFDPKNIHLLGGRKLPNKPRETHQMTDIASIFEKLDLTSYIEVFADNGFETWEDVLDITEADLETLGVKIGHRRRLQREIATWKGVSIDQIITMSDRVSSIEGGQAGESDSRIARYDTTQTSNTGKRRYRRHPKPDANAPERPPSAYVLFSNQVREELKPQNLSFTEIAKIVGERWQQLDTKGREPYESQATSMKNDYNARLSDYKKTEQWRDYQEYWSNFKAAQAQSSGSTGEGKRLKLERAPDSSHGGSSLGSGGTPTSTHGSPISVTSSNMHISLPETAANSQSLPPPVSGFAGYQHQMSAARNTATPPGLTSVYGQAGSGEPGPQFPLGQASLVHHNLLPLPPSAPSNLPPNTTVSSFTGEPSRNRSRRINNPPFLQSQDASTGSSSSFSQTSIQSTSTFGNSNPGALSVSGAGYHTPGTMEDEPTSIYAQRSMHRLSIGTPSNDLSGASSIPYGGSSPPASDTAIASRTLPLPQPLSGYGQVARGSAPLPPLNLQLNHAQMPSSKLDSMSMLALAGKMVDSDAPKDKKPKPP